MTSLKNCFKKGKMLKSKIFFVVVITALLSSCSVKRYLPPGERLYRGASIKIEKHPELTTSSKSIKSDIKIAIQPRPNKFFLGQPWKVWWWYTIGPPRREKGLKAFLRNKLGEPPVLSSRVNAENTAKNIEGRLENLGYFHSTAQGDTTNKSYFTKAHYTVQVFPQYTINEISWPGDSIKVINQLRRIQGQTRSLLKKGNGYNLDDIANERTRLDLILKNRGYYFFNPDYIMAYADSTVGGRKVNLFLNLKSTTPEVAKYSYKINDIVVYPTYSLAEINADTSRNDFFMYDSIYIKNNENKFKPRIFKTAITYRPGDLYSTRTQNATLNRFINLGSFKFVKNRFEIADSANHNLNVYYYLTPAKKKSIQFGIDAFSKDNNYVGTQLSVNWKNRNTFKGSEELSIKGFGGIEYGYSDSLKNSNYRIGADATLRIPRYAIPFINIPENYFYPPITNISLGYEMLIKKLFYNKNLFHAQYDFTWKPDNKQQFTFAPFSLSYLNATNISDTFMKQAAVTPSLLLNVYSEAILGTYLSYSLKHLSRNRKNQWFFTAGLDLSGNLAGLITGAKHFREKEILGTPFAQYVKTDFDVRYTRKLSKTLDLANRFQLGIGIPYNNSALLPFTKQYIIGGTNSLRGFSVRSVGPGSYKPTAEDQKFFQTIGGDFKILMNNELRFPIAGKLKGAVFSDAGNIWTKDTIQFGPKSKLTKDWFKEIAVSGGVGVRFDATILLIRLDVGIPFRKPYLPEGERWVFDKIDFGSSAWRRENIVINIAIGYPF